MECCFFRDEITAGLISAVKDLMAENRVPAAALLLQARRKNGSALTGSDYFLQLAEALTKAGLPGLSILQAQVQPLAFMSSGCTSLSCGPAVTWSICCAQHPLEDPLMIYRHTCTWGLGA